MATPNDSPSTWLRTGPLTAEQRCEHPGLDTSGACIECGECCTLVAMQGAMCLDTECPLHGAH